ncbi:hypothetical protein ACA910_003853 [Epithemia clementina (nom. ined.)]
MARQSFTWPSAKFLSTPSSSASLVLLLNVLIIIILNGQVGGFAPPQIRVITHLPLISSSSSSTAPKATTKRTTSSTTTTTIRFHGRPCRQTVRLNAASTSPLPKGLSPFEKSFSKSLDIQGNFRKLAASALERALRDGETKLELEFPPLAGGDQSKSQFDDFDNLSELDANRDWCVQWAPMLSNIRRVIWFVLPDDKEVELAKQAWTGQRYRRACRFTSIRAALSAVLEKSSNNSETRDDGPKLTLAWGSTLASTVNKVFQGGDGILADSSALDALEDEDVTTNPRLHLVCQPGNGGPVEDWINVQTLHQVSNAASATTATATTCIVNGALDKVRDGYYPSIFFPALAATKPFYDSFQAVFWLKPISDKGLYGWLYRVYPEPWQVVLQTVVVQQQEGRDGQPTRITVQDTVALVSDQRPTYKQAVDALVKTASTVKAKNK